MVNLSISGLVGFRNQMVNDLKNEDLHVNPYLELIGHIEVDEKVSI